MKIGRTCKQNTHTHTRAKVEGKSTEERLKDSVCLVTSVCLLACMTLTLTYVPSPPTFVPPPWIPECKIQYGGPFLADLAISDLFSKTHYRQHQGRILRDSGRSELLGAESSGRMKELHIRHLHPLPTPSSLFILPDSHIPLLSLSVFLYPSTLSSASE